MIARASDPQEVEVLTAARHHARLVAGEPLERLEAVAVEPGELEVLTPRGGAHLALHHGGGLFDTPLQEGAHLIDHLRVRLGVGLADARR